MLGIELNFGQKLQVGFILLMFAIAGYLVFRNTRPTVETTVTSWVETRSVGIDASRPVSAKNPADPTKTLTLTIFAFHDGHLEITEYPADSDLKPFFVFRPDLKRATYDIYKSPTAKLNAITDPYKHLLVSYSYNMADGHANGQNPVAKLGLSKDQTDTEKALRQTMLDQVDRIQEGAKAGIYLTEKYENVIRALAEYKAKDGDPTKDSTKAALARKVLDRALEFLNHLQQDEAVAVEQYITGVDTLLTADQKAKLAEFGAKAATTPIHTPKPNRTRTPS